MELDYIFHLDKQDILDQFVAAVDIVQQKNDQSVHVAEHFAVSFDYTLVGQMAGYYRPVVHKSWINANLLES